MPVIQCGCGVQLYYTITADSWREEWGDQVFDCGPGSMVRVPPDVVHYAEAVGDEVCLNLDVFAPVRKDYLHLVDYQKP